ncbi:MAG TPA: hypothetical protein PLP86_12495, partial [Armatimonadota bacterium]|nr:hypothetical protein [Armatimonadota bacterium]
VIEEYLRSYRPGDGSVLTLYAGRLTNSTADEAYRLVGDFLERLGVGEEVIPDMEISDELPVDPTVKIILTDGPLDSNLRSGFPDSCVEADALRPAA